MSNKVIHSEVDVYITTKSGYRSREEFGTHLNGSEALKQGLREIARILAINGESELALATVAEAVNAVKEDLAKA